MAEIRKDRVEGDAATGAYLGTQIVVDLRHERLLRQKLEEVGVTPPEKPVSNVVLGLAVLELGDPGLWRIPDREQVVTRMKAAANGRGGPPSELDTLLFHVRERFGEEYDGWEPEFAKNRLYAEGTPYTGGGQGDPEKLKTGESVVIPDREVVNGPRVRIGLLDTPLFAHPRLSGRYLADTAALLPPKGDPLVTQGHAVHLAGILAQQAPNADLIVRQALTDFEVDSWTLATKMVEFRNEVDILVTALGGTTWDNQPPMVLRRAEARLGCVHVSSAGNWGNVDDPLRFPSPTRRSAIFPGALADVIAVGALDESGERTPYSQSGPWVTAMAPGRHGSLFLERAGLVGRDAKGVFFSTGVVELFGGFARWDGTSAAAAYFAGVVAAEAQNRETSVEEAVHRLLDGPATSRIRPFDPERDKY